MQERLSPVVSFLRDPYAYPKFWSKTSCLQISYALMSSLTVFPVGLAIGFSAVSVPQLYKGEGGFVITIEEAGWIVGVLNLATPVGCLIGGYLLDKYGRRFMLVFCEIPMAIGWMYTGFSKSALDMIIGRIITGVGVGMTIGPPRIYITEISLPNMRGMLGTLLSFALALGMTVQVCLIRNNSLVCHVFGFADGLFVCYFIVCKEWQPGFLMLTHAAILYGYVEATLGSFLNWKTLCYIGGVYAIVLSIANIFIPESPYYVLLKDSPEKTKETLKKFRCKSYNIDKEMKRLLIYKRNYEIRKLTFKQKFRALFRKTACKPFWIMAPFILFTQLSGVSVVLFYAVEILQESKSSVDAYAGNVMLSITKLLCCMIASCLIYSVRRRVLILISMLCVSPICVFLSLYLIYSQDHTGFPQLCYMAYIGCASTGFHSLALVVMYELYPLQVRGLLGGITVSLSHLFMFAANTLFPLLKRWMGLAGIIVWFGINAALGAIFLYFRLPETKGLRLEQIEYKFRRRPLSKLIPRDPATSTMQMFNKQIQDLGMSAIILGGVARTRV